MHHQLKEHIMDYEAYENHLPYPKKEDFSIRFWYQTGKVVAMKKGDAEIKILLKSFQKDALTGCKTDTEFDTAAYQGALCAYAAETSRLEDQFRRDFFVELGIEDHPRREKLYAKAYEHGHSDGYAEIMNCGYDLVELIKD
jgi:hypothetical protein